MFGYIYKTTNTINNKIYIGQHRSSIFEPLNYIGSGTLLWRAINKYGIENFKNELICECMSQEELDEKEIYWISFYNSTDFSIGYNITEGGRGGAGPRSDETKEKIRLANTGKTLVNDGTICFRIFQDDLEEFLSLGYNYGPLPYTRSESFKNKVKDALTGKIGVSKGNIKTKIDKDELPRYLADGYIVGWYPKKEYVRKTVEGTGRYKYMNKNGEYKKVPESRWSEFLESGWVFGAKGNRKKFIHKKGYKLSDEVRKKLSESHKGHINSKESIEKQKLSRRKHFELFGAKSKDTIWIVKDGKTKMVKKDILSEYLSNGWRKGRK